MRGIDVDQNDMFSYVSLEDRVPQDHPLRAIRRTADEALRNLTQDFASLYSTIGRPSIPPEKLLRALILQILYSVRSERMLMEQMDYNLLFRWFVGLSMDEPVWDATVFSKNRDRLIEGQIAGEFFQQVVGQARDRDLLSDEHFSADGTLIEAWASEKSFQPKAEPPKKGSGSRGEMLLNDTHASKTDPDARMFRKKKGDPFRLCHQAHVLSENRNGLVVATQVTAANTKAEREAALEMLEEVGNCARRRTVGADKNFDDNYFVMEARKLGVTPHVAQYGGQRSSEIDRRTTRHRGYSISLKKRKRIEQIFGWVKTVGLLAKTRHRGTVLVGWIFQLVTATYNLVRIKNIEGLNA